MIRGLRSSVAQTKCSHTREYECRDIRSLYIDPPGSTSLETVETVSFIRAPASTPLKRGVNDSGAGVHWLMVSPGIRIWGFRRVPQFGPRITRGRAGNARAPQPARPAMSKRFARQFACD